MRRKVLCAPLYFVLFGWGGDCVSFKHHKQFLNKENQTRRRDWEPFPGKVHTTFNHIKAPSVSVWPVVVWGSKELRVICWGSDDPTMSLTFTLFSFYLSSALSCPRYFFLFVKLLYQDKLSGGSITFFQVPSSFTPFFQEGLLPSKVQAGLPPSSKVQKKVYLYYLLLKSKQVCLLLPTSKYVYPFFQDQSRSTHFF